MVISFIGSINHLHVIYYVLCGYEIFNLNYNSIVYSYNGCELLRYER